MRCSRSDEDGMHLRRGAAPSLPEGYNQAIEGAAIGPRAGSCGTAMYFGRTIIATDVLVDPVWEDYRELAVAYGFRACWSTPIFSAQRRVLGSFAMYYPDPRPRSTKKHGWSKSPPTSPASRSSTTGRWKHCGGAKSAIAPFCARYQTGCSSWTSMAGSSTTTRRIQQISWSHPRCSSAKRSGTCCRRSSRVLLRPQWPVPWRQTSRRSSSTRSNRSGAALLKVRRPL